MTTGQLHLRNMTNMRFPLLFLTLLLAVGLQAQDQLPPVPAGKVITITPEAGYKNEPSIAVNAKDPSQLVAAYQKRSAVAYSQDGGNSWKIAAGTAPADYRVSGDVSVTYDKRGTAILCYIAFDKLGTINYWAHGATRNGIFVRRSLDGGATWETEARTVAAQQTKPGIPFEDKPYIVADNTNSKYAGNLYIGWTRWRLLDSQMVLSRSTDDGKTWSAPVEIDAHPGLPRDDNGAAEGFAGVVAPDGKLYAIWSQDNDIMLTSSRDGGK